MEMTSRERILTALRHEEPELLPIDFGGMRSTGINALAYQKLKKYLGINIDQPLKLYDVFQQLAEPELEIVKRLGGDVVQAHRYCPAFGLKIDAWKPGKLQDGSDCLVPINYNPVKNERGELEIRDGKTVIAKMPVNGLYFDQVYHPYENVETFADIDRIPITEVTDEELQFLGKEVKILYENTDKAILFAFGGNIFEAGQINWGYEKFFIDLSLNPDLVHYYFQKITDAYMRDLEKIMPVIGKYIHLIQFGDDLGTQEALQISPKMYREMIQPYHARQYQYIRNNYPNVKVFLHSCGAIYDLLPDLIDAGIEVLNPVQISAKGMDPVKLKKEYGKRITFWGGGANMQYTVPGGTIEHIKKEVKELISIFAPGGGYVFNQVHNIQANISPEKILAIYDTALESRKSLK